VETPTRNLNHPFGGMHVRNTEEVGDRHITGPRGVCTLTTRTPKPQWKGKVVVMGDGHIGQGLSQGKAWSKARSDSGNRESWRHEYFDIENAEKWYQSGILFVYCRQRRQEEDRVVEDSVMIVCR
jgi:hypothetical protein